MYSYFSFDRKTQACLPKSSSRLPIYVHPYPYVRDTDGSRHFVAIVLPPHSASEAYSASLLSCHLGFFMRLDFLVWICSIHLSGFLILWWGATAQNSSLALVSCQVINRRVFLCGLCQGSGHHPHYQGHRQDHDYRTVTSFRQSTTFMIIFIVQNGIQHSFLN